MAATDSTGTRPTSRQLGTAPRWRIPPNLFGIAFGLAGLGRAWHAAGPVLGIPARYRMPSTSWLPGHGWPWHGLRGQGPRRVLADPRDPVLAPFASLAAITPMMLAAALAAVAFTAGRILVIIFLAVTIGLGGWLIGEWIAGDLDHESVHPGYYLPTVAASPARHFSAVARGPAVIQAAEGACQGRRRDRAHVRHHVPAARRGAGQ